MAVEGNTIRRIRNNMVEDLDKKLNVEVVENSTGVVLLRNDGEDEENITEFLLLRVDGEDVENTTEFLLRGDVEDVENTTEFLLRVDVEDVENTTEFLLRGLLEAAIASAYPRRRLR
jgi:transcriptional/translational regulatory protein YebC/TACO1